MKILDSNIWIAFFNIEDSQHNKAQKIFKVLENEKIIITEYIILEVASVLLNKAGRGVANTFIEMAIDNEDVELLLSDEDIFKITLMRFQQGFKKKLSFIDASLVCLSGEYEIMTFDKDLKNEINFL